VTAGPLFHYRSAWRGYWDSAMLLLIIAVCIIIPLRIGFILREWWQWIPVDAVFLLLFGADIFITANTTYEFDGEEVTDTDLIRRRYIRGWLIPDIISILPLELFSLTLGMYEPAFLANRLLRVPRIVPYFLAWERSSSIKPSIIRIVKSVFVVIFIAHFIGCIFHLIILLEGDAAKPDFTGSEGILEKGLGSRYIRSFYWSFVTMTGYNNTDPQTEAETIFSIFVTLIGISLFATIIGTVGSLVTNLDSSKLYFRQKMDAINDYMQYKKIPDELQSEVRNYFMYLWKSGKGLDKNQVLDDLPSYLKNKMSTFLNSELIKKVPLFASCKEDPDFVTEVVKSLRPRICLPNSFVVRKGEIGTEMYFVSRGELNVISDQHVVVATLKDGSFFGEIAIMYDTKRTATIVTRTYCDMFVLTKEDFKKVLRKFPTQAREIQEIAETRYQLATSTMSTKPMSMSDADRDGIAALLPKPRKESLESQDDDHAPNPLGAAATTMRSYSESEGEDSPPQ
jgi:CRP-like cAMP-binding protein